MCPKRKRDIWPAEPHTLAKIELVRRYLDAWLPIMGRGFPGSPILYIDGFAGPGIYERGEDGSPIVAKKAASKAIAIAKDDWRAGDVHIAAIEMNKAFVQSLSDRVALTERHPRVHVSVKEGTFEEQLNVIRAEYPFAFRNGNPLFAFIDPFGPTHVPFSAVKDIMSSSTSEILINLGAFGIDRIKSHPVPGNIAALDQIFGDHEWSNQLDKGNNYKQSCRNILRAYRDRLHKIQRVAYTFPFEMRDWQDKHSYYLLFATGHPTGMVKMKQAMRKVGQAESFEFSDAWTGQLSMFRDDIPVDHAERMATFFPTNVPIQWRQVVDYSLNESTFDNPKAMLRALEQIGRLTVASTDPKRRNGQFPDNKIVSVTFQ